ncbi:MAG: sodium-translocating pyrophosphatase, partial [Bacteroidia bacterium]
MISSLFWIVPVASLTALLFAWIFFKGLMKKSEGTDRMKEIALYVREGAMAYLTRQYKVVAIVFLFLVILLSILAYMGVQNPFVPIAFLTGGVFSGLCGYLGMRTATYASARTAHGASKSLNQGLQIAFRSGAVMGFVVVGFALLDIAAWFLLLTKVIFTPEHMEHGLRFLGLWFVHEGTGEHQKMIEITATMLTFGMGASTQALFARVGGGIYTKA